MSFKTKNITYFKKPGIENTDKTIELAVDYAKKNKIQTILIASATGKSALKLKEKAPDLDVVCVTYSEAVSYREELEEFKKNKNLLEEKGIRIVKCAHAFSGVEKSVSVKYQGALPHLLIADVLRLFSEGVKVAVESSLMAVDSGAIKPKEDILTIGGSGEGVDTCLLVSPTCTSKFFEFGILEIICIPKYNGLLHK